LNLLWQRHKPSSDSSKINSNKLNDSRHWAEEVLDRLNETGALANDLRGTFPQEIFADTFEILDIFHIPGKALKLLAHFKESNPSAETAVIVINFYHENESLSNHQIAIGRAINPTKIGLISKWHAVARIFPEDADLPGLGGMLELKKVAEILGEPVNINFNANWKMLRYQAGKRCALRYDFNHTGSQYFGKTQSGDEAAKTHQRLCQMWNHPERRFNMPRPIACDKDLGARWEAFVPGVSLEEALLNGDLTALITEITRNLTYLHTLEIPDLPPMTPNIVLRRIEKKILPRMASLVPVLAVRAERLFKKLEDRIKWVENTQKVTLHGDFHIANFLLNDDGMVIIDLDDICLGDPCYDLALFGSRLLLRNFHNADRLPETLQMVAELPNLYTKLSGYLIRAETFAWYVAALLIGRQIKSCMRVDAPDMEKLIRILLDWAEDSLEHGRFRGEIIE
jgi:aminoglycoside phosphotransferase